MAVFRFHFLYFTTGSLLLKHAWYSFRKTLGGLEYYAIWFIFPRQDNISHRHPWLVLDPPCAQYATNPYFCGSLINNRQIAGISDTVWVDKYNDNDLIFQHSSSFSLTPSLEGPKARPLLWFDEITLSASYKPIPLLNVPSDHHATFIAWCTFPRRRIGRDPTCTSKQFFLWF